MRFQPAFDKPAAMNNAVSCRNTMPQICRQRGVIATGGVK
jgi:hypothetical protein